MKARNQYIVTAGEDSAFSEVILRLAPADALLLLQRIANQLDLKNMSTVSIVLNADVRAVS